MPIFPIIDSRGGLRSSTTTSSTTKTTMHNKFIILRGTSSRKWRNAFEIKSIKLNYIAAHRPIRALTASPQEETVSRHRHARLGKFTYTDRSGITVLSGPFTYNLKVHSCRIEVQQKYQFKYNTRKI